MSVWLQPLFQTAPMRWLLVLPLLAGLWCWPVTAVQAQPADYGSWYTQGNELYQQGRLTEAIAAYQKALPLARGESIPIAYNNVAAIYMKRGNYFLKKQSDVARAVNDFRLAVFYMDVGWPEGLAYSDNQRNNRKIALQNLVVGHQRARIGTTPEALAELAGNLRRQGQFKLAAAEYAQALDAAKGNHPPSLKALGDLFLVLNDAHKAKKYYRKLVEISPNIDTDTLLRLANAEYQSGDIDAAIDRLNQVTEAEPNNVAALRQLEQIWLTELRYTPNNPLVHANLASVFQKQRLHEKSLRAYTNAERLAAQAPGFPRAASHDIRLNMGTLHRETNHPKLAFQAFDSVLRENPQHERALLLMGMLQRDTGHPAEAAQTFERLLATNPKNNEAATELLNALANHPDPNQKQRQLEQLAQRFPNNAGLQATVGERLHAMANPQAAIPYYRQALAVLPPNDPSTASIHANLGSALQSTGNMQQAYEHLETARTLDPSNAVVTELAEKTKSSLWQSTYHQALEAQHQQRNKAALALYDTTMATAKQHSQPLPAEVLANYGLALQADGQLDKALAQYNVAIKEDPNTGVFYYYRATAYHQKQQTALAKRDYDLALNDASLEPDIRAAITTASEQLAAGQVNTVLSDAMEAYEKKAFPQALQLLDKADTLQADLPYTAYYRGLIYDEQGQTTKAITAYQQAIKRDAAMADAYYGLAIAYENAGKPADAKTQYAEYVKRMGTTTNETTQYAKSRLAALSAT